MITGKVKITYKYNDCEGSFLCTYIYDSDIGMSISYDGKLIRCLTSGMDDEEINIILETGNILFSPEDTPNAKVVDHIPETSCPFYEAPIIVEEKEKENV